MTQPTASPRYLTCAETAKLVRAALKAAFPGVKFSVRSRTHSGGASIDVGWLDGPTVKAVKEVTDQYRRADFDGMQDLMVYRSTVLVDGTGAPVRSGADFIVGHRELSPEMTERLRELASQIMREPVELDRWYPNGAATEWGVWPDGNGAQFVRWLAERVDG